MGFTALNRVFYRPYFREIGPDLGRVGTTALVVRKIDVLFCAWISKITLFQHFKTWLCVGYCNLLSGECP
jgi:hypothetical protein